MSHRNSRRPAGPDSPARPSRRALLGAGSMAALAGALAGCGTSVGAGFTGGTLSPSRLTYWNLFSGGDGVRMRAMERAYSHQHPDIDLEASTLTWGNPYYTKLSLATLGAQPPDVAVSHLTRMPTLAKADLLEPLPADLLARYGMSADNFVHKAIQRSKVNGKQYAIPLDTHPFVMFYNTDVCKKAGLIDKSGKLVSMDSEDAFVEALAKAKKVTGHTGGAVAVIGDIATPWRLFYSLYGQLGGEVLEGPDGHHIFDHGLAVRAASFMRRLTIEAKVMPSSIDYGGAVALFANGRAGFYFQGEWEISTFQDAKTPFSMQRFPNVFGGPYAVQADSHSFVIPRGNTNPARLDTTMKFIRAMLDHSMIWAKGGHIPAWLPVQDSAQYRHLKPQSNYAGVAEHAVYDPPAWFSGSGSDFEQVTGSALQGVLSGRTKPEATVAKMRDGVAKLAELPSPLSSSS